MIILIGGEKGGTGKTTLATNLAAACAIKGKDILLIDTDKQGSSSSWIATREFALVTPTIHSVQKFGSNIHSQITDLKTRYGEIIIDAGGKDNVEIRSAMCVADKVYIPIQPSQFDIWTISLINQLVRDVKIINPSLKAFIIINRATTHHNSGEINDAKEIITEFEDVSLSNTIIKDRIAYRRAAKEGKSVLELDKKDIKADFEIKQLYEEIYG